MAHAIANTDPKLKRNGINQIALALVWLTMATSSLVFVEPAPVDALTLILIIGLPVAGLVAFPRGSVPIIVTSAILGVMVLLSTATVTDDFKVAAPYGGDFAASAKHALISCYLILSGLILMAFVAMRPVAHSRLILGGLLFAAVFASAMALIGYFNLAGPASELFVKFDRAAGTFKDPNVLGAYLILPLLAAMHLVMQRRGWMRFAGAVSAVLIVLALLFTFSRGAWLMTAVAVLTYGALMVFAARSNCRRLQVVLILGFTGLAATLILATALQSPEVREFFIQRAQAVQSYDAGPEGRFGGQVRAVDAILTHPFGLGAMQFVPRYHPELPHNVYLNIFLKSGWIGGFAYLALVLATLIIGFGFALKRTPQQMTFIAVFSGFVSLFVIGFLVDTDHWRHFYVNAALVWGLMIARPPTVPSLTATARRRAPRIVGAAPVPRNISPERRRTILGNARRRLRPNPPQPRRRREHRPRRPQRIAYTARLDRAGSSGGIAEPRRWQPRRASRIVSTTED
jgi:O-antigen ligase